MFGKDKEITRELYELIIETSSFDHGAEIDELTRDQDLSRWGWCKVHNGSFRPHGDFDRVRRIRAGVCGSCDHALDMWRMRDNENVARINGRHWVIGDVLTTELDPTKSLADLVAEAQKMPRAGKGCGGQVHIVRFNDGRTVITNDLWGQGEVPDLVAAWLPDNAEFVEVA